MRACAREIPIRCIEVGLLARIRAAISPDLASSLDTDVLDGMTAHSAVSPGTRRIGRSMSQASIRTKAIPSKRTADSTLDPVRDSTKVSKHGLLRLETL